VAWEGRISRRFLTPLKEKHRTIQRILGFDIETQNKNKEFLCGSIWSGDAAECRTFWNRDELAEYVLHRRFHNCIIAASNLSFDFFGAFHNHEAMNNARLLWRGGRLLRATMSAWGGNAIRDSKERITFLDTMNYLPASVESLGEIIGVPKIKPPACLRFNEGGDAVMYGDIVPELPESRLILNDAERRQVIAYNMRDSQISAMAMSFFYDGFLSLGAEPKCTIASTAMNLFRTHYLHEKYPIPPVHILREQFLGYYGGRTEAFSRGKIIDKNFYDVNSLYPSVMLEEYPNPASLHVMENKPLKDMIGLLEFEGLSEVEMIAPECAYPILPIRHENKLMFPIGRLPPSWQTHAELRKSLEMGYDIIAMHKTYYYTRNCSPFREYVTDLYAKRMRDKGTPIEIIDKNLLTNLYGKFGQKFDNLDDMQPFARYSYDDIMKLKCPVRIGDYLQFKQGQGIPPPFSMPIWSIYTTAKGRLRLHELLVKYKADYCDTDSIITSAKMPTSKDLGALKLEMHIDEGVIVRPKFYMLKGLKDEKEFAVVKSKGVGTRISLDGFNELMMGKKISYYKFAKLKESLRRGFIPNEIFPYCKQLALEDTKRKWLHEFNPKIYEQSLPISLF
jgi:hypothetical protein